MSVASDYTLDVQADDAWSINVQQPKPSPSDPMPPQTFSGKGMSVSPLLALADGAVKFKLQHNGAKEFTVWLLDQNGVRLSQLAHAAGNFNGAMSEDVAAGTCLLDITADCNWTISVEQ